MTDRRYHIGQRWSRDGIHYRIVAGDKPVECGEEDHRLEWTINGLWIPVSLEHVALILSVIGENENVLYPHGSGNGKVMTFASQAIRYGHEQANYWLQIERARKRGQSVNGLASLRRYEMREESA